MSMEVASDYQHRQRMLRQVAKTHKLKANTKKEIGRHLHHLSEQFASRRRFERSHQTPRAVRHQARRYSSSGRPPSVEAVLARMEENGSGPDQATHAMGTGGTDDSPQQTDQTGGYHSPSDVRHASLARSSGRKMSADLALRTLTLPTDG